MKKNIIVVLLLSFSIAIGQQVTISDAQKAARNYLRNYGYSDVSITEQFSYDRNNRPNIYVFNTDVKAWVMISGDYRATPVLAMGFDEYYDTLNDIPNAMKYIVEDYIAQIENVRNNTSGQYRINNQWEELTSDNYSVRNTYQPGVELLAKNHKRGKVLWGQKYVNDDSTNCLDISYNMYAPTWNPLLGLLDDCDCKLPPAGCGPVAMGQIMWYWQWPKKSPIPFREGYNWNIMPNELLATSTWEESKEVAYLLKDLGDAANSIYKCKGTSTFDYECRNTFAMFDYKSVARAYRGDWNYGYSWTELVRSEIDNERPVMIGGYSSYPEGGHFFIADGYRSFDNNLFHINWGWRREYTNSWVRLSNIVVGDHNYTSHRVAFVGISPTYSDTVVNKAFYETIKKTDYELSKSTMALPAIGENLIIESDAELTLLAGKEIVLSPGFEAKEGSEVSIIVDTELVNRMPIIVSEWPTMVEEGSDGLYVPVRNANSYELTARDTFGHVRYQTAGLVRDNPVRIWNRDYDYDPSVTYDCSVRFKNNFGRALQHTFRINAEETRNVEYEMRMARRGQGENITLKVQPNPASGWFSICLDGMSNCDIILYNAKGEPCLRDVNINNGYYFIDASAYPSGIYFVTVRSGDVESSAKVIIR